MLFQVVGSRRHGATIRLINGRAATHGTSLGSPMTVHWNGRTLLFYERHNKRQRKIAVSIKKKKKKKGKEKTPTQKPGVLSPPLGD